MIKRDCDCGKCDWCKFVARVRGMRRRTTIMRSRRPACTHLGGKLPGQPCGSDLYTCELFGDATTRTGRCTSANRSCTNCQDYKGEP